MDPESPTAPKESADPPPGLEGTGNLRADPDPARDPADGGPGPDWEPIRPGTVPKLRQSSNRSDWFVDWDPPGQTVDQVAATNFDRLVQSHDWTDIQTAEELSAQTTGKPWNRRRVAALRGRRDDQAPNWRLSELVAVATVFDVPLIELLDARGFADWVRIEDREVDGRRLVTDVTAGDWIGRLFLGSTAATTAWATKTPADGKDD